VVQLGQPDPGHYRRGGDVQVFSGATQAAPQRHYFYRDGIRHWPPLSQISAGSDERPDYHFLTNSMGDAGVRGFGKRDAIAVRVFDHHDLHLFVHDGLAGIDPQFA